MGVRSIDPAGVVLLRIGRPPDPLAWPPPEFRGGGRFDDPENAFGVRSASASRTACFLETLDVYRPDLALLQRLRAMGPDPLAPRAGLVPDDSFARLIARFRIAPGRHLLDLRIDAPETAAEISRDPTMVDRLQVRGYGQRIKPGDLLGSDRRLTQTVARWAFDQGYAGLAYSCSHRPRLDCWAVFEGTPLVVAGPPQPVEPDDPELAAVAQEFGLTIGDSRHR